MAPGLEYADFLDQPGVTFGHLRGLLAAAFLLLAEGLELALHPAEVLGQRFLHRHRARPHLFGEHQIGVEGGELAGLLIQPFGDITVMPR